MMNFRNKPRKKRSVIYSVDDMTFKELVLRSKGVGEVLKHFGLRNVGGSHNTLKRRIEALDIDTSHFNSDRAYMYRKGAGASLFDVMTENSTYPRSHLKTRIIKEKIIPYQCKECGQGPEWMGKELVLILDHINGVHDDNRKENLQFLCPNCNAQQPTFAGRNKKYASVV